MVHRWPSFFPLSLYGTLFPHVFPSLARCEGPSMRVGGLWLPFLPCSCCRPAFCVERTLKRRIWEGHCAACPSKQFVVVCSRHGIRLGFECRTVCDFNTESRRCDSISLELPRSLCRFFDMMGSGRRASMMRYDFRDGLRRWGELDKLTVMSLPGLWQSGFTAHTG
ncbi:hypothetical protein BJX68DRAFT_208614 [Aspergillus pseudodeflectus]|uniref:Secreted protein n=1 Tax=Aspergillus pseudodeflectus TaxID=176178 RepID=A0ABR4JIC1_9EURO